MGRALVGSGGGGQGASARSAATGGESVVQISGLNQIALRVRSVRRVWLPTPVQILNLSSLTGNQATTTVSLGQLPPHTVAALLNVQVRINSGTNPQANVYFHNDAANAGFAASVGAFGHGNGNNAQAGQVIVPIVNGQMVYELATAGTVNFNVTVNLVAVEVM